MSKFVKFLVAAGAAVSTFFALTSSVLAQSYTYDYDPSYAAGASAGAGIFGLVFFLVYCCIGLVAFAAHVYTCILIAKDAEQKGLDNGVMWAILYFFFSGLALLAYLYFNRNWKMGETSMDRMMDNAKKSVDNMVDKAKDAVDGDK